MKLSPPTWSFPSLSLARAPDSRHVLRSRVKPKSRIKVLVKDKVHTEGRRAQEHA